MHRRRDPHNASVLGFLLLASCTFDASGTSVGGTSESTTASTSFDTSTGPQDSSSTSSASSTSQDTTTSTSAPESSSSEPEGSGSSGSSESGAVRGWWDTNWSTRRRIALALPDDVAGPLDGVPVLLLLDDTTIAYDELQNRGQDLRFIDADDNTVLSHEIEVWDPSGQSVVWVQIPEFTADDSIYMYWGNGTASNGVDAAGVWSPGYAGVWHLDDNPENDAPQILDSSPSFRDATAQGGMTLSDVVPAFASPGLNFDGIDDQVRVGSINTDGWDALTVSAWVFHGNDTDDRIVSKAFDTGPNDHVFMLGAHGPDVKLRLRTDGAGAASVELRPQNSLPPNTWAYLTMVWSGASNQLELFVNGDLVASAALGGDTLADGNHDVLIANAVTGEDRYWLGIIDEVRIEHDARSPEWISTQFSSMSNDLATFEGEESVP